MIDIFLEENHVYVLDNLSLGSTDNIQKYLSNPRFHFIKHDLSDPITTIKVFRDISEDPESPKILEVWHLAANSDIPSGVEDPNVDLRDTFMTTHSILAAMKEVGANKLYFASSSAVYGDMDGVPISEDKGPLLPISNYGAMKLASEALISAAAEAFLEVALLFRFPNVVGVPATHGVILDLTNKLIKDPDVLSVLGNGTQKKSYLHVSDLVQGMLFLRDNNAKNIDIFNIGPKDDGIFVREIAEAVVARVSPSANIQYGKSDRGWVGDVPKFSYLTDKLAAAGWTPQLSSHEAVKKAVAEIEKQQR